MGETVPEPVAEGMLAIDAAGHRVHWERYGDGEQTLIALHGGPGLDGRYMRRFGELASDRLSVVLYDQLGGGRSDRPDDPALWTAERFADELEAVRAGLGLGRVHVAGHSWGGMLALQHALTHPQAVRSLVLSNMAASFAEILQSVDRLRARLPVDVYKRMRQREAAGQLDAPDYVDALLGSVIAVGFRRCTPYEPERSKAELVEQVLPLLGEPGPPKQTMLGANEFVVDGNLLEWDLRDRLHELAVPTLVLAGWHDEIHPDVPRRMAEAIRGSECLIFGRSSHMMMLEHEADAYLGAIRDFIARHAQGA